MADEPTYEALKQRIKALEDSELSRRMTEKMLPASIFDDIDEVLYVADLDTYEILYVNKTAQKTFEKELIGGICYREFQGFDAPCPFCTNHIITEQRPAPHRWEYYNPKLKKHYTIVDRIIQWSDGRDVRLELAVDITARKQAEEALKESQERFSGMFEHMSSGVAVYKPINRGEDFIFTAFNTAAEKITNITREDAVGSRLLDLFPNMDRSGLLGHLQTVYKTGMPQRIPPFYYEDETRKGWRENLIYKLPTGEIVALFDDVTDQKQAELKLKQLLEDTLTQKREIEALLKASRAIPLCNTFKEAARTIFDISIESIGAKSGYVAMLSDDGEENEVLFLESGGLPCTVDPSLPMPIRGLREVAYRTRKVVYDNNFSKSRWVQYMPAGHVELRNVLFAPLNINDKTVGIMGLANKPEGFDDKDLEMAAAFGDLAAVALTYAQSRENLTISEEKFAKAFINAPLMMTISSLEDGCYLDINEKFAEITGYTKDVAIGSTSVEIGFISKAYRDFLKGELINKGFIHEVELELYKADGSKMYCLYSGELITVGEDKRLLSLAVDISERKDMEKRLQQAQKMESIGSLAGGIAHDFNNILFPIVGMSELLLEDLSPGSNEHENAQEILRAGRRGADLVRQILAFSRQGEHKIIPVRIQKILKEALKLSRATIPVNIKIVQDLQQDFGLVMANPTQIHQVVMNLMTNAYHAVEFREGRISIHLEETLLKKEDADKLELGPGKYARLTISDNGYGIPKEVTHKIFDPYFTTKKLGKGTGLGLSVVYGIIKEHHGEITVKSEVGKGSVFTLLLPIMQRESFELPQNKTLASEKGEEHILLVDDEESIARLESQMLGRLGYKVTFQVNSQKALSLFKSTPENFDLVITDMTMPGMTGDQFAKKVLSIRPEIPIIICTGFSEQINDETAEAIGVKGFLMKPVVKSDMARMVRNVLEQAKKR